MDKPQFDDAGGTCHFLQRNAWCNEKFGEFHRETLGRRSINPIVSQAKVQIHPVGSNRCIRGRFLWQLPLGYQPIQTSDYGLNCPDEDTGTDDGCRGENST
jgi:hypothetical protein